MRVSNVLLMIWGICIALVLVGCGQAQPENTPADQSAMEKTDAPSIKSEAEIKGDLAENQDFYTLFDYNCYDSYGNYADSAYSIDELTITRRKTDKDAGTDDNSQQPG